MLFLSLFAISTILILAVCLRDCFKRSYTEGKVKEERLIEKIEALLDRIKYPLEHEVRKFGYFSVFQDRLKYIFDEFRQCLNPFLIDKEYIDELEQKYSRRVLEELERDFRKREFEK